MNQTWGLQIFRLMLSQLSNILKNFIFFGRLQIVSVTIHLFLIFWKAPGQKFTTIKICLTRGKAESLCILILSELADHLGLIHVQFPVKGCISWGLCSTIPNKQYHTYKYCYCNFYPLLIAEGFPKAQRNSLRLLPLQAQRHDFQCVGQFVCPPG